MRLVIGTNVFVSALFNDRSLPSYLIKLWRAGQFDLLISIDQLDELRRATHYPKIRARLAPALAGRLINELRDSAIMVSKLPAVTICRDPDDNYLLATATAGSADFIITGDKRDLLGLKLYNGTRIIGIRDFLVLNRRLA